MRTYQILKKKKFAFAHTYSDLNVGLFSWRAQTSITSSVNHFAYVIHRKPVQSQVKDSKAN